MRRFFEQYQFNVSKNPLHEGPESLPESPPEIAPVKLIAYYLPQFHAIPENDTWWGKGFTEWTNVTKALPRYLGHQQPRMPADLGFYDLRHVEVLRSQANLARRGGIHGFCIHDYWFSGHKVLETPLRVLLANPDIDLPFCLNWANENWTRRWDGMDHQVLLEQRHDAGDGVGYATSILPALRDPRYIRINGRPLLMVYRPALLNDARAIVAQWRSFFVDHGVGNPYVVMAHRDGDPRPYGIDAAAGFPPHNGGFQMPNERQSVRLFHQGFRGDVRSYEEMAQRTLLNRTADYRLFPGVCPGWDNEARRPNQGNGFYGSTPAIYGTWLREAARQAEAAPSADERLVFINAWNEWAEGAYLEPDRHFGYAYLAETRRVLESLASGRDVPRSPAPTQTQASLMRPRPSTRNRTVNRLFRLWNKATRVAGLLQGR